MKYFFDLSNFTSDKSTRLLKTQTDSLERIASLIKGIESVATPTEYNRLIADAVGILKSNRRPVRAKSFLYDREILPIKKSAPLTEKTLWGGVSLKKVDTEKNFVKKFLFVDK